VNANKGVYLGTDIVEHWWSRLPKTEICPRSRGTWWYDERGFYFQRHLTEHPIFIPVKSIIRMQLGKRHAGTWVITSHILKIFWNQDNLKLSSGFIISKSRSEAVRLIRLLSRTSAAA